MCILAAVAAVAACGDAATAPATDDDLALSVASAVLEPGQSLQIRVTEGTVAPVRWSSSNSTVARVTASGLVTAAGPGTAVIVASSGNADGSAQVRVGPPSSTEALAFEDEFETGAQGATGKGFKWRGAGGKVSADVARSGRHSLKFSYSGDPDPCADASSEQRFELGEDLEEVWFEYYIYLPDGTEGIGPKFTHRAPACASKNDANGAVTNNKFMALWDTVYSKSNGGDVRALLEYRRSSAGADGDSFLYGMWGTDTRIAGRYAHPGSAWDPAFTDALRGRWVQVRVRAKVADSKAAANGVIQVWVDGALRIDMQDLDLAPEEGGARYFRNGYLMGWANSGFDQNTAVYLDDFKVYRFSPGW